jgi:nicotinamidase-related amidase
MLEQKDCCLVVVDVQGKLARSMFDKDHLFDNIQILVKTAKILDIPVVWCQQRPEALGPTVPQIAELLTESRPVDKSSFSCCGQDIFNTKLRALGRQQVLLCGIEAHVCIYQTTVDLLRRAYTVDIIADAISSRTLENKQLAIQRMSDEGAHINSTEMALFELLRTAEHTKFRQITKLIKYSN